MAYVFDNAGRLTSSTANGKTISYQVDAAGNRVRTTWPEATPFFVTTDFDALNRPTAIQELGMTSLVSYAYDDLSRRSTVTLGNGTSTTYGYDSQAALSSLVHNLAGTAQDTTYGYMGGAIRYVTSGGNWSAVFDAKSMAVDAALGAVGAGLTNKAITLYQGAKSASLANQANKVHSVLDPIAQSQRTWYCQH